MDNKMNTLFFAAVATCLMATVAGAGFPTCTGTDCVIYNANYAECTEVTSDRPTRDCRWKANYNRRVDEIILNGTIVAYQILWSNDRWSHWFVPGQNDIDWKFNTAAQSCSIPLLADSLRRVWAYFYDHNHKYIICKYE